ncbi:hypothetical protein EUAN_06840 [Andreesenia angusta]|uniref:DUF2634 domain-containing protein n=1 Tax=Andreesenia angusta TaxID=39480 RepID=A0A1S1V925_9FIRM|nr:DUF2634 domain-containing protein [Andreesenia angusta]OHW62900.1 hypothetical protein EUAN_06840 [Andreesenia angusta]
MFPTENLDSVLDTSTKEAEVNIGINFLYDFDKGDFVVKDGKLIKVEGKDAIKIWIEKQIRTEKFKYEIYKQDDRESEYGIGIKQLLGRKLPQYYVESEIKRQITESLLEHPSIVAIENFKVTMERTTARINFRVVLDGEESFSQEVKV